MEKIKQALAKVKSQESTKKSRVHDVASSFEKRNSLVGNEDIGHIEYSKTKVVKLDLAHLEKNRVVAHRSEDANTGVFNTLRTQVLQKMSENSWQTLAIVSPTPESGKTIVSINLAVSIAHQPQKTALLLDFDLRRPRIANYLGLHADKSINEYFAGQAGIEEIITNPDIQRLVVIPTMRPILRSAEMLSSNKTKDLIQELKHRYESRIIILDLPPLLSTDDAMVVMPQVDCVLMVVANGVSTPEEIEKAFNLLPKEKLVGVVYNKADEEAKAYYY